MECRDCLQVFERPSFSEGPKTKNPETGVEDVRFAQSRVMCPFCMSQRIALGATLSETTLQE